MKPADVAARGPLKPRTSSDLHVVLVEPRIPPNTGNIARLCVGFEIRLHLVRPLGFQITDKHLKRAGLDYWKNLDLEIHDDLPSALALLPERRFFYTAHGARTYSAIRHQPHDVLIFGPEPTGLSQEILRQAGEDRTVRIPTTGAVRSLNLANCVALVSAHALCHIRPQVFLPAPEPT